MEEKTREERISELLDQPDAVSQIKGPSLADLAVDEPKSEIPTESEEDEDKKVRIPRSRLKTLTSRIDELEAKLQEKSDMEQRFATLEAQIVDRNTEEELPDWWKEAWGDSPESKKAYKDQSRLMQESIKQQLSQIEQERKQMDLVRQEQISAIEKSFDEQMDELEEELGRELTATQKSELLDIVGEYSPMEGEQYLAYIPISKAYDIWNKTQNVNPGKQEMARIASIPSQGQTVQSSERPHWGSWRQKYFGDE